MFTRLEKLLRFGFAPLLMTFIEGDGGGDAGGAAAGDAGAGDAGPLDRDQRIESALEIFEGKKDDADAGNGPGGEDGEDGSGANADEGADADDADKGDQGDDGQKLSDEQLQKDPRFQALDNFQKEHKPIFEKYGVPNAKELDLQLADSAVLYQIMEGKGTPSQLLETMSQAGNWSKEQQQGVAKDLIGWLTKNGYLKDGQAADGGQARGADGKFKDPLEERLNKFEQERADEKRQATERTELDRRTKIFDTFKGELNKLAKEKNIEPADVDFYGREIRALIKTDAEFKTFSDAIEKGNFVKVRELFAQVYNREVERLKRFTNATTKTHERRVKSAPRVPAGGAPPAPAGQQKRNLQNRDERLAAATAEFDK